MLELREVAGVAGELVELSELAEETIGPRVRSDKPEGLFHKNTVATCFSGRREYETVLVQFHIYSNRSTPSKMIGTLHAHLISRYINITII